MFQHTKVWPALRGTVALVGLGVLTATGWAASPTAGRPQATETVQTGCRDGWRRVGTVKDPTLRRSWAVVKSCAHPAWPAHLEPASRWKALPKWVPAGSRVTVTAPGGVTSMRLAGKTLNPGRVGQAVDVRLVDGARVRAKLIAADTVEIESATRGRWK